MNTGTEKTSVANLETPERLRRVITKQSDLYAHSSAIHGLSPKLLALLGQ